MPLRYLALDDFDHAAKQRLPRCIYGFIAGGSETCATLEGNRKAFVDYRFVPRVLTDTSVRSLQTELFGQKIEAPFGIPPMGAINVAARNGDMALAMAAEKAGIPFILSAAALTPMEKIIKAAPSSWFQAYLPGEDDRIIPLVERVMRAGFGTLVLTVDLPVPGNRENNVRNGWNMPLRPSLSLGLDGIIHLKWLLSTAFVTLAFDGMPHFENMDADRGPPIVSRSLSRDIGRREALSWDHVRLMRDRWPGKLVLKGILAPEDAVIAQSAGVDGIIVSNHGGRQLDGAIESLHALPAIATAAPGLTLLLDGGVRRGSDVLKALALGAHAVLVGRPFLYAATVGGQAGAAHAITLLSQEIDRNMAMLGITSLGQLGPTLLRRAGPMA
jgi:L-lactate dehydrogenase (cytochrome)